jgi:hypothetical protein
MPYSASVCNYLITYIKTEYKASIFYSYIYIQDFIYVTLFGRHERDSVGTIILKLISNQGVTPALFWDVTRRPVVREECVALSYFASGTVCWGGFWRK